jgi:hypothetical protein
MGMESLNESEEKSSFTYLFLKGTLLLVNLFHNCKNNNEDKKILINVYENSLEDIYVSFCPFCCLSLGIEIIWCVLKEIIINCNGNLGGDLYHLHTKIY